MRPSMLSALRPFALFTLCALVLLSLSRLGLSLWLWERLAPTDGLAFVLLQGLRFDIVVIAMLLFIPASLTPLLLQFRTLARYWYPLVYLYLSLCFAVLVLLELSTPGFILQYDARPNRIFFEYLLYPKEIISMLLTGYKLQLAVALPGTLFAAVWMWRRLRRTGEGLEAQRYPWQGVLLTPLLVVLLAFAIRSTTDHRPVNPSTVAFSADALVNTLPLSSLYQVLYAAYETTREDDTRFVYGEMELAEATELVRQELAPAHFRFDDEQLPTLHYQAATRERERPLNLVIILEESLGAEFVGALGGPPLTPNLDRLSSEGIWFEQLYATGTRSVRGIEAVTTGFTPTPARAVVKLNRSQRGFFTLADLLSRHGYDTSFIYGGESHFDNMARFFTGNGFQHIIDENDYVNPVFYGSWGVSDEDLFARAHEEFQAAGERPFFSLVFTSSNHSPYVYPEGRIEPYDTQPDTVNNAVKYADYALGRFIEQARHSSYWDNTLFLIVADHNSRVYGAELLPVERFHIPGLILGGSITPERIDAVASQIDLDPTLLSLMGLSTQHPMIGRDLTRPELRRLPGHAIMQYFNTQAYMSGDRVILMSPGKPPQQYRYVEKRLQPDELDPQLARVALAHQVWGASMYRNGNYHLPAQMAAHSTGAAPVHN